ncbi:MULTISPECIES: GntR family transcriptional regulator [Tissierellales]|jgi:DNA-binding transcriptional regulator YhcF (GntR family)|uniref:GntR family transcriptional regulator n=1 Tax=Acidilutibacter cellobiosedens TaxID=2507161 RepID=A0A410QAG1_9FIRM|nr:MULTISPECIES: GntR family transcriptional regulator [Tissierellales]QAT60864.1 GntR family transcriptional regulator [Acidilutibacter cellobiosedens]SCL90543.1 HTH-type transcriptional repressor YtrA [Sporanaerobacter sp. PP17-6a]
MEFKDDLPIYVQIMSLIKKRIISGELNGGDKMPSVREFSTELKVNPNTVQRAYQELERENLVFTQRGMGTFVSKDEEIIMKLKKNMADEIVDGFINDMKFLGYSSNEIINLITIKIKKEE